MSAAMLTNAMAEGKSGGSMVFRMSGRASGNGGRFCAIQAGPARECRFGLLEPRLLFGISVAVQPHGHGPPGFVGKVTAAYLCTTCNQADPRTKRSWMWEVNVDSRRWIPRSSGKSRAKVERQHIRRGPRTSSLRKRQGSPAAREGPLPGPKGPASRSR